MTLKGLIMLALHHALKNVLIHGWKTDRLFDHAHQQYLHRLKYIFLENETQAIFEDIGIQTDHRQQASPADIRNEEKNTHPVDQKGKRIGKEKIGKCLDVVR